MNIVDACQNNWIGGIVVVNKYPEPALCMAERGLSQLEKTLHIPRYVAQPQKKS